jgi:hypothetical protein
VFGAAYFSHVIGFTCSKQTPLKPCLHCVSSILQGELTVLLREGRDLPVWGMPWQSNPWVRLVLGEQAVASRRDSETSTASRHGAPVWNQEVQFLVEDPDKQVRNAFLFCCVALYCVILYGINPYTLGLFLCWLAVGQQARCTGVEPGGAAPG